MYLAGSIERMGTGTGDIIDKCEAAGLRAPQFIQDEDFKVVLWRPEAETDQATDQAEKRIMLVVKLLDIPRKRSELQELLGIKHNHTFRHNYINPALERGYIAQSHPDKPTHQDQTYFLTEKGRKFMK
jgi:predicted HTH transcriptional regulator